MVARCRREVRVGTLGIGGGAKQVDGVGDDFRRGSCGCRPCQSTFFQKKDGEIAWAGANCKPFSLTCVDISR